VRRVTLLVFPLDTSVEVDGTRADVVDGGVDIAGELGSGHPVRLFQGEAELRAEVFITEKGAVPSRLELAGTPDAGGALTAIPKPRPGGATRGAAGAPVRPADDIMRNAE
jgi:serine/threonine-protein kinase